MSVGAIDPSTYCFSVEVAMCMLWLDQKSKIEKDFDTYMLWYMFGCDLSVARKFGVDFA